MDKKTKVEEMITERIFEIFGDDAIVQLLSIVDNRMLMKVDGIYIVGIYDGNRAKLYPVSTYITNKDGTVTTSFYDDDEDEITPTTFDTTKYKQKIVDVREG